MFESVFNPSGIGLPMKSSNSGIFKTPLLGLGIGADQAWRSEFKFPEANWSWTKNCAYISLRWDTATGKCPETQAAQLTQRWTRRNIELYLCRHWYMCGRMPMQAWKGQRTYGNLFSSSTRESCRRNLDLEVWQQVSTCRATLWAWKPSKWWKVRTR